MLPLPQVFSQYPDLTWKEKIAYLTTQFLSAEQTDCPVTHHFESGRYIREMRIPAKTLFIGRAHRHGHECELLEGTVIHFTPEGGREISAPFSMHTTPGYHMVLMAVTDVIGRTIHANPDESRDTQALEDDIFESVECLRALGDSIARRIGVSP